jgi:hypothetical protein
MIVKVFLAARCLAVAVAFTVPPPTRIVSQFSILQKSSNLLNIKSALVYCHNTPIRRFNLIKSRSFGRSCSGIDLMRFANCITFLSPISNVDVCCYREAATTTCQLMLHSWFWNGQLRLSPRQKNIWWERKGRCVLRPNSCRGYCRSAEGDKNLCSAIIFLVLIISSSEEC